MTHVGPPEPPRPAPSRTTSSSDGSTLLKAGGLLGGLAALITAYVAACGPVSGDKPAAQPSPQATQPAPVAPAPAGGDKCAVKAGGDIRIDDGGKIEVCPSSTNVYPGATDPPLEGGVVYRDKVMLLKSGYCGSGSTPRGWLDFDAPRAGADGSSNPSGIDLMGAICVGVASVQNGTMMGKFGNVRPSTATACKESAELGGLTEIDFNQLAAQQARRKLGYCFITDQGNVAYARVIGLGAPMGRSHEGPIPSMKLSVTLWTLEGQ